MVTSWLFAVVIDWVTFIPPFVHWKLELLVSVPLRPISADYCVSSPSVVDKKAVCIKVDLISLMTMSSMTSKSKGTWNALVRTRSGS